MGAGSVGESIVLLEHVMLVMAKIGHNVKSKHLIDIYCQAVMPLPLPGPIF